MPDWGMYDGGRHEVTKDAAGSSGALVATASATVSTKGAWTQMLAATAIESSWMTVHLSALSATARYLVDIGIGAAGAEQTVIANIPVNGNSTNASLMISLPLAIPPGVRVAYRCQCSVASGTLRAQVVLSQGGMNQAPPLGRATTWGPSLGTTRGALVDSGATANTKGAWSQITATTEHSIRWLCVCFMHAAITVAGIHVLTDIGIGAAGAEGIVVPDLFMYYTTSAETVLTGAICIPVNIPAGVRIAARMQANITNATATDTQFDVILIGVG